MQQVKIAVLNYKKNRQWIENMHIVMQLGLTMAGSIMFCFFVGYYLDKWLGTKGIFITLFIIFGVLGGSNVVYRQIMEITNESSKSSPLDDDNHGNHG
ncbi:MAG: AtpZ/AtpI family protein [Thermodesulfobacteriota bacterium]|nr:AtpZ/AtpI family protein [Thermodesulfobacteriota bacterium]